MGKTRKSGGSRKMGRNKKGCERYRLLGKREENKLRKAEKRLKGIGHKYPDRKYYIEKIEKGFQFRWKNKNKK